MLCEIEYFKMILYISTTRKVLQAGKIIKKAVAAYRAEKKPNSLIGACPTSSWMNLLCQLVTVLKKQKPYLIGRDSITYFFSHIFPVYFFIFIELSLASSFITII